MLIGQPSLLQLLSSIREGHLVLPDIQRDFVWDRDQIYLFCDSLFRGYPIGSFLFWDVLGGSDSTSTLVYRGFLEEYREGGTLRAGTELAQGDEKLLVLDGQQRLQSAYLCFFGTYEGEELYLDVMTGQHDYDREHDLQFYVRFTRESDLPGFYRLPAGQGRKMVRIKDFLQFDDERMERYAQRKAEDLRVEDTFAASRRIRKVWQALRSPERIHIITIDPNIRRPEDATSLTEVAEIFVRVNSGGTRLTKSELLFTLLKARWRYARDEFQALCEELNSRGEFEVDTDFIIRALMVFAGGSARLDLKRMREDELLQTFEKIFPRAKAGLQSAFDLLTQPTGGAIRTYRLLTGGQRADRGYNVLLPVAHFLFLRPTQEIPESERRRLRRYLYAGHLFALSGHLRRGTR